MARNIPQEGLAILNADDEKVISFKDKIKSPAMLFGIGEDAEIKASYISFNYRNFEPQGISFKLSYEGKVIPIRLPYILAPHLIYAVLASVATGIFFKINMIEVASYLEGYAPPSGRMNLIKGIGNSYVIDDTYNSSPTSALAALDVIKDLKAIRKIAALGDMLELGGDSESLHEEVLKKAFSNGSTVFFLAGSRMKKAGENLESRGEISGKIFYFDDPESLGKELRKILREGDLVLAKGSQGMRMEKAVKEIMEKPEEAENFLCRQSKDWQKKPFLKL